MGEVIMVVALAASFSAASDTSEKKAPQVEWNVPDRSLTETLSQLAKAGGKDPDVYRVYRRKGARAMLSDNAFVTTMDVGRTTFAVAVQVVEPGTRMSAQQIVLLTAKGEIVDPVQCDINSRYGRTKTEILPKPDPDGAQIIIRFAGYKLPSGKETWWHNLHTIVHDGKSRTYYQQNTDKPDIWAEKGLCRIKIADRKFVVVFPDPRGKGGITPLEESDEKP